jgi:hypothetical protein
MMRIGRQTVWRAAVGAAGLGAIALLVWVIACSDILLSLRLHQLNVVFHRRADGTVGLAFKDGANQSQVENVLAVLDGSNEAQNCS